jgi:LysM repeat protein
MTSLATMVRFARACVFIICCAPFAVAAQPASNGGGSDDMETIRQMLEQQSRQIDVLAQEIARLNLLLEEKNGGAVPTGAEGAVETQPAAAPESTPPKAVAIAAPATETSPAPPTGPVHVVTKGETLTAIARRYKVTVPELLKVNKIADARKLQIGQTLALPPDAKIPESPTPSPQP